MVDTRVERVLEVHLGELKLELGAPLIDLGAAAGHLRDDTILVAERAMNGLSEGEEAR